MPPIRPRVLCLLLALPARVPVEGAGRDIENAGEELEETAAETRQDV
jgi:predicted small secreted protein